METPPKSFPQYLATFPGNIAAMVTGCVLGWTSPSLPTLLSTGVITQEDASWIGALMPLGAAVGAWPAGLFALKLGRKKALIFSAVPVMASYACLAVALPIYLLYLGRFLGGIYVGWIYTVMPMYCGEIAHASVRGAIGSLLGIFFVFGLLFDYCIGPYVPYVWLSIGSAIIPLAYVVMFLWMPETPYYLQGQGDHAGAKKSLQWLRGQENVSEELQMIQLSVASVKGTVADLIANKGNIRAITLLLGLMFFQQLSGTTVVLFYAQSIFTEVGGTLSPELSTIICGLVKLASAMIIPFMIDSLGRRKLLMISGVLMALAYVVLGVCFFLKSNGTDISSFAFLPVVSVVITLVGYSIGIGPLPWSILGEILAENIKPMASMIVSCFCWLMAFAVTFAFNYLLQAIGSAFTFWIFAICCALSVLFVFFLQPETKEKTLLEIQEILNR